MKASTYYGKPIDRCTRGELAAFMVADEVTLEDDELPDAGEVANSIAARLMLDAP